KEHLRRIPLDGRADLPGVELHVIDAGLPEGDGELEADRSGADDGYSHEFILSRERGEGSGAHVRGASGHQIVRPSARPQDKLEVLLRSPIMFRVRSRRACAWMAAERTGRTVRWAGRRDGRAPVPGRSS